MLSQLSTKQHSRNDFESIIPLPTSDSPDLRRLSVKEKVHFYEQLSVPKELYIPKSRSSLRKYKVTMGGSSKDLMGDKENQQTQISNLTNSRNTRKPKPALKVHSLVANDRIQPKKRKQLETEVSCSFDYQEKPVECIKEEKEKRTQKIEILEKRVKSVRNQHRDSLKRGDVVKAESLFKKLQTMESKLAKQTTTTQKSKLANQMSVNKKLSENNDEIMIEQNDLVSETQLDESSSVIEFDEQNLNGDFWGGIIPTMVEKYCVDEESTWRTFSSYSVNINDDHTELVLDSNSSLHADIFPNSLDDLDEEDYNYGDAEFCKEDGKYQNFDHTNLNAMDELQVKYNSVKQNLQSTRLELAGFRARLYEALHQLAKTEYQMRIYQVQLLQSQTNHLEMEKEIERQRVILNDYEKQELEREIKQLKEETKIRKQQVEELRKQIRSSISILPLEEQTDLMVEDPFIECSVRMLDNNKTPIQRISDLESKLSTLISQPDIRIKKKSMYIHNMQ